MRMNLFTTLEDDVRIIRRLGALGARPAPISVKLGADRWSQATVSSILRDYFGKVGAPGRRSTGSPAEMSKRYSTDTTLFHLLFQISTTHSTKPLQSIADAFEVYHFVARHLDEPKLNIESAMFLIDRISLDEFKPARCRRCDAPRLIPQAAIAMLFTCSDCEQVFRKDSETAAVT